MYFVYLKEFLGKVILTRDDSSGAPFGVVKIEIPLEYHDALRNSAFPFPDTKKQEPKKYKSLSQAWLRLGFHHYFSERYNINVLYHNTVNLGCSKRTISETVDNDIVLNEENSSVYNKSVHQKIREIENSLSTSQRAALPWSGAKDLTPSEKLLYLVFKIQLSGKVELEEDVSSNAPFKIVKIIVPPEHLQEVMHSEFPLCKKNGFVSAIAFNRYYGAWQRCGYKLVSREDGVNVMEFDQDIYQHKKESVAANTERRIMRRAANVIEQMAETASDSVAAASSSERIAIGALLDL
jgi:hypothetical protein